MVVANDSTNSMRSSAMYVFFSSPFGISSAKNHPHWLLDIHNNLSTCGIFRLAHIKYSVRVVHEKDFFKTTVCA